MKTKKKKYVGDFIKIAQIGDHLLRPITSALLFQRASFIDTQKNLNEFMVSIEELPNLVNEIERQHDWKFKKEVIKELNEIYAEVKDKYSFIQVTYI